MILKKIFKTTKHANKTISKMFLNQNIVYLFQPCSSGPLTNVEQWNNWKILQRVHAACRNNIVSYVVVTLQCRRYIQARRVTSYFKRNLWQEHRFCELRCHAKNVKKCMNNLCNTCSISKLYRIVRRHTKKLGFFR